MSKQAVEWALTRSQSKGSAQMILCQIANQIPEGTDRCSMHVSEVCRLAKVSLPTYHQSMKILRDLGELERHTRAGGPADHPNDATRPNLFVMPMLAMRFSSDR